MLLVGRAHVPPRQLSKGNHFRVSDLEFGVSGLRQKKFRFQGVVSDGNLQDSSPLPNPAGL